MYSRSYQKLDGRNIIFYNRDAQGAVPEDFFVPSPAGSLDVKANPQLRWHPFRGEWVIYASHRQNRTFLPPAEYDPLAPSTSRDFPTELPQGNYDVAVFENLFPSLSLKAKHEELDLKIPTEAGKGTCEVVLFSQDPQTSLGRLPLSMIELILEVWAERTQTLGQKSEIQYVMPFENRGIEMGVTLAHPHGQIYAYPFVPPVAERSQNQALAFYQKTRSTLMGNFLEAELADNRRIIFMSPETLAFVPACARYPYEVWVAPRRPAARLNDLNPVQRAELARALKTVLLKYDNLWQRSFPYLMVIHQAPTDGLPHPEAHLHIEFSPPYRSRDRLKFLAGTELGAGIFANDSVPEEKAAELRAVEVNCEL